MPAPAPLDLSTGVQYFDAGHYWEAHEAWEEVWLELRGQGRDPEREFVQSLILVAAALHRAINSGSQLGGRLNLVKAERHLQAAAPVLNGISATGLLRAATLAVETGRAMPAIADA